MIHPTIDIHTEDITNTAFWKHIVNDDSLQDLGNLEKLVVGCELIAALDDLHLLAA